MDVPLTTDYLPLTTDHSVLILGAGIHGAAIARELLLNGVPVQLVDSADIAFGATAKSSRLIHGGLRYLEYGDVKLVRESLLERQRLLELAPHFVRPLRLFIPVRTSWSGLVRSAVGFLGGQRAAWGQWFNTGPEPRGFWPTRIGLQMYDWLSGDTGLPGSEAVEIGASGTPRVDASRYVGLLAYSDAQMLYPERFVLALLADAADIAREKQLPFDVRTWSDVSGTLSSIPDTPAPAVIVNATGAWGDFTRRRLGIEHEPFFGGTKGSHLITYHAGLREALAGQAVYAEADDGRLVFVLPFGDAVLIGTTDETFTASPELATVTAEEQEYLLRMANQVFALSLTPADIALQYSGVRPLPKPGSGPNAAISRDHEIVWENCGGFPLATLVGGKLTTWRAFAEIVCDEVLARVPKPRTESTQARPIPGNDTLPQGLVPGLELWQHWAGEYATRPEEVAALWPLFGTRLCTILGETRHESHAPLPDAPWSAAVVRWIIRHEWVTCLDDLVERRLMAVFAPVLSERQLQALAECLVAEGRLTTDAVPAALERCRNRLGQFYGRQL
jgi:glycerol-3-phosphate dehydrogenase